MILKLIYELQFFLQFVELLRMELKGQSMAGIEVHQTVIIHLQMT